jgi:hypothetical protein
MKKSVIHLSPISSLMACSFVRQAQGAAVQRRAANTTQGAAKSPSRHVRGSFRVDGGYGIADERARTETQKCVSESQTCADLIAALAQDKNLWTISTTSIPDDDLLGEPSYNTQAVPGVGVYVRGGTLLIEGSAKKYAKASQQTGAPITYRTILAHEAGHVVGNLLFQQFGPLSLTNQHCDELCALGPTNAYRRDVGLRPLILRR